jgi:hypothetical protein
MLAVAEGLGKIALGRHVAQWVFSHFLRSVDADETDEHEDEGDDE